MASRLIPLATGAELRVTRASAELAVACAERWGYREGSDWLAGHCLFCAARESAASTT
jgi:hypothetical protein